MMAALNIQSAGIVIGVIAVLIAIIRRVFSNEHDPREPPLVSSTIPFVGHLLHMMKSGTNYIDRLWYRL
jgi:hypothetical protein